jgi:hypothetical protein
VIGVADFVAAVIVLASVVLCTVALIAWWESFK